MILPLVNNNFRHLLKSIQEIKYDDKQDDNNEERLKSIQTPFDKSILNHVNDGDGEDEDVFISSEQQSPYHRTHSMDETSVMSISEYHDAEDNVSFVGQPTRSSDDYNSSSSSSSIDDEEDDDESIVTDFSEDSHKQNGCLKPEQQVAVKRRTQLPSAEPTSEFF